MEIMTNREKINAMPNEEFAELLVAATEDEEVDYSHTLPPYKINFLLYNISNTQLM